MAALIPDVKILVFLKESILGRFKMQHATIWDQHRHLGLMDSIYSTKKSFKNNCAVDLLKLPMTNPLLFANVWPLGGMQMG